MRHTPRFKRFAIAVGLTGAFGAVTAFGVAPLTELELPPAQYVTDPVPLAVQTPEPFDRFSQVETIRRGDTLAQVLARAGAGDAEFMRFAASDPIGRKALQLLPGRSVQLETDSLGRVTRFSYRTGGLELDSGGDEANQVLTRVEIRRAGQHLVSTEDTIPIERSIEMRSAEIQSSLFAATDGAGIPEGVALQIADILAGDVDFTRDLRRGDRLRVAYETIREQGSLDAPQASRVLAVELVNGNRRIEAFWLARGGRGEYFTSDGRSLKRSFLRNPLVFSRLSSGFSASRLHPIHRDWRAHRGVDFFAPAGTPIRATADGVVDFVGSQRGFGNMIVIRHNGTHSTLYAHLRSFSEGVKPGVKVTQGDVIGAVGATGWATGPHLHYEVKVNGEHVDPMKADLPGSRLAGGRPLEGQELARFTGKVSALREQFARLDTLRLARFE